MKFYHSKSRAAFLSSLSAVGAASIAGCAGVYNGLSDRRSPEAYCNPGTGQCTSPPPLQTPPPYASTGGVNPSAWQKFGQHAGGNGITISSGYNEAGWLVAHGGNNSAGAFLYTGSTEVASSGTNYASTLTVKNSNIPGNPTASITVPQQIPTNGTCPTSAGTLDTTNQNAYGTITFAVQGTLCSLTVTATDGTGNNFNYAYKNLSTGYVYNFPVSIPTSTIAANVRAIAMAGRHRELSRAVCFTIEVFGLSLAILAAILTAIALPEAIAGAAYAATMGATVSGATWSAITLGVIHQLGC